MTSLTLRRARFLVLVSSVACALATPVWGQVPPCGDGNIDLGEFCDDGPLNGQPASFCTADCTIRPPSGGDCGNGTLDMPEDCDEGAANGNHGSCCTAECAFRAAATPCRQPAGVCDLVDTCTGSSGTCVDDKSIAVCRAAPGVCDVAESCDGVDDDCPADDFEPNTVECRGSADVCDAAESCTGTSAACPADDFEPNTVECRGSAGVCDVAESCTGTSAACPADDFETNTVECRGNAGVCDVAESCTGTSAACPVNAFEPNTVECRGSAGVCDIAESCTGTSAPCPVNAFEPNTVECRGSAGVCDPVESCTGSTAACPADAKSTAVCRGAAGVCDLAESCNGVADDCPADAKSTAVCRAVAGGCDVAETCDGVADTCPVDAFESNAVQCRADAGDCDVAAEFCTGNDAACPADTFEPDETPCDDVNPCSINDRCIGGTCGGFLVLCGNGMIENVCLEECDDGGNDPGDGCDESCRLEPCGPEPLLGCRQLTAAGKAVVQLFDREDEKDRIQWKYGPGDTTLKADFGSPAATTTYQFCIYDRTSSVSNIVSSMHIPAGGTCGTKPCWKETGSGWKYTNRAGTPQGVTSLNLKQGTAPGKTRIQVVARGIHVPMPSLPFVQDPDVVFQLSSSEGVCWQAFYLPPASRNIDTQFKDK